MVVFCCSFLFSVAGFVDFEPDVEGCGETAGLVAESSDSEQAETAKRQKAIRKIAFQDILRIT